MQVLQNFSLKKYNSFAINVFAEQFARFASVAELHELLISAENNFRPTLILGGGSNVLFTGNINGLVLKNEYSGIETAEEHDDAIFLKVGAGENWHQFVLYCISKNLGGVENLSLIPGNVGAAPMQNIGAYGVELKDAFYELEAFHIKEKRVVKFKLKDCSFGYRESIFKTTYKNQFVILTVTFRLLKQPVFNTRYGAIEQELAKMAVNELSVQAISQAVINIRRSKLPDPAIIGNAGSFFKNPEVTASKFGKLKEQFPAIVGYILEGGNVKLAAGWLIEQCGWKGYREGDAGCHSKQALVLVNYGNADGKQIFDLSKKILESVKKKFGVILEREVNVV